MASGAVVVKGFEELKRQIHKLSSELSVAISPENKWFIAVGLENVDYQYHSNNYYTPHQRTVYFLGLSHYTTNPGWNYRFNIRAGLDNAGNDIQGIHLPDKQYIDAQAGFNFPLWKTRFELGGGYFSNSNYQAIQYFARIDF